MRLSKAMKNKHASRLRISEAKVREVVRCFAADLTALQAAALSGLNRNTVDRLYRGLRERLLLACEAQRPLFGVVEVDVRLPLEKRIVADTLGMKPETLSRAIAKVRNVGVRYHRADDVFRVRDVRALLAFCESAEAEA